MEIFDALARARIDGLLLKGAALAQLLYEPGEPRSYADVDLLVAPPDLAAARQALAGLGYRDAGSANLGIDDVGGVIHEESWIRDRPGQPQVMAELHERLSGAGADPECVWRTLCATATAIELHGRRVPVLGLPGQAVHLALHAAQHGAQYAKGRRELTMGLERWSYEIWAAAAKLAAEIGATDAFAAGLRLVPAGAELADVLSLPANVRLEWEIRQGSRPRGTFHLDALLGSASPRERLMVIRRALVPSRLWIAWQYPWSRDRWVLTLAAYALHTARTPLWAARAWRYRRAAARAAGR